MTKIKKTHKAFIFLFWGLYSAGLIFIITIFVLISSGKMGFMPTFEHLENPKSLLASEVISEDGAIIGKYYFQNRSLIDFDDLSPNLVKAILAIEDIRFENHSGIDVRGLARVAVKTILLGQTDAGGGSTITQQLAKNLFGRDTTTYNSPFQRKVSLVITKFKEWVTAIRLERNYTKREILVMYLNTVFFGSNSYGIKSAAKTFFNKSPEKLTIEEAALLAGVINKPTRFNPVFNPELSLQRRNLVLEQMAKYEYITHKTCDSLQKSPIKLDYSLQNQNEGLAPYLREYIRIIMTADKPQKSDYYSVDDYKKDSVRWITEPLYGWINKNKKPDGTPYNLYKDGLRIHTTINTKMQKYAEKAVAEHLGDTLQQLFFQEKKGRQYAPFSKDLEPHQIKYILKQSMRTTWRYKQLRRKGLSEDSIIKIFNKPVKMKIFTWEGEKDTIMSPMDSIKYYKHLLRAGFISVNPHNGHIKAYVGGINFKHFKYDHVCVGKRQVGSTIKPFLYTLAMQEGLSPCKKVPNVPITFSVDDTTWTPRNSGASKYEGEMVTLKWGLANSINYISAWLINRFGSKPVVKLIENMGVTTDVLAVPSVFLGTSDISLYEMAGAYSTFVNKGVHIKPMLVTHIEDKTGNIIHRFNPQKKEAISKETAYKMLILLEGVVNQGTAIRLRYKYNFKSQLGGKTGTTQNHSDGWFIGIAPKLVSAAWVGGENRSIHFDYITHGQGAFMALPIFAKYLKKVYQDTTLNVTPQDTFQRPANFHFQTDCKEYNKQNIQDEYVNPDF